MGDKSRILIVGGMLWESRSAPIVSKPLLVSIEMSDDNLRLPTAGR